MATLKEGNSFGELALIEHDGKRHATIITENATNLIVLKRHDFNLCLKKLEQKSQDQMVEFVSQVPALSCLSRGVILKIVKSLNKLEYVRGQNVVSENFTEFIKIEEEG